ncbi:Alpha-hemolysin translocation ATP-binding protein HlyB [Microbacterium azadirachtae]|uniref:Alpha-hemolysin translocation ATP-binding protein HlyB n=1 Tax=Microbacterium azadirachtae TaxID=582680 RepID=A0A0F0KUU6_9MICO|nr:ABC transporter ATP-binding protein [Microbacterium azadirachtae]KJL23880.1 Alpha-hemolysin translocation ATP-binding protein HlyB [Microbacterium azadirachtae]
MNLFSYLLSLSPVATAVALLASTVEGVVQVCFPLLIGITVGRAAMGESIFVYLVLACLSLGLGYAMRPIISVAGLRIQGLTSRDQLLRLGEDSLSSPFLESIESPAHREALAVTKSRFPQLDLALSYLTTEAPRVCVVTLGGAVLVASLGYWGLALALVMAIGLDGLWSAKVSRREIDGRDELGENLAMAQYAGSVPLMAENAKELRIFGMHGYFRSRYDVSAGDAHRRLRSLRVSTVKSTWTAGVIRIVTAAICLVAVGLQMTGAPAVESVATVIPMIVLLASIDLSPLRTLAAGSRAVRDLSTMSRLPPLSLKARPREWPPPAHGRANDPLSSGPGEVEFVDVSFKYPESDRLVLSNLSLHLKAGEAHAIVGVNGAGKSTILKLLMGGYTPSSGDVVVDGTSLASLAPDSLSAWQRSISVVAQDATRLPLSAVASVTLEEGAPDGHVDCDFSALLRASRLASFEDVVKRLPDGWRTPLGAGRRGAVDLSGGEWQKLALVRALYKAHRLGSLLVMDEPLSALDASSEAAIVSDYLQMVNGMSSIIVSHRLSVVKVVPDIVLIDRGGVSERGSHQELMTLNGRYARMFRAQAAQYVGPKK